jgi:catechol 2,3-dioxygenase
MSDETLPATAGIGRVALRVADLDAVVSFYRDVVGLAVRSRAAERATLGTADSGLLELTAAPDTPARPDSAAGLFHTAFRVPSRAALADALARVRDGWQLSGASDHAVSEALYLRDPEGNGVEIYRDRERAAWPTDDGGRVGMVTEPLDLDELASAAGDERGASATVPVGTDVGHVHLEVTSLRSARERYGDALGMNVRQETGGALFLAAGEYHHHVGANVWNRRSTPAAGLGLDWFEVVVPDAGALAAVRERFDRADVATESVDGGEAELAVTDGDGIGLRVRVAD